MRDAGLFKGVYVEILSIAVAQVDPRSRLERRKEIGLLLIAHEPAKSHGYDGYCEASRIHFADHFASNLADAVVIAWDIATVEANATALPIKAARNANAAGVDDAFHALQARNLKHVMRANNVIGHKLVRKILTFWNSCSMDYRIHPLCRIF